MTKCRRYDNIEFTAKRTDEGYIMDTPIVGRIGIQQYMNADGTIRRELRLPEEVFDPASLASHEGKPIIDGHPSIPVTAANYKKLAVGSILSQGWQDGDYVRDKIVIQDADTVDKAVKGGKKALSLGYSLDLDEAPGQWNGERYDAIQRNIRINHLAIVGQGRAGDKARLNLDAADAVQVEPSKEEPNMPKQTVQVRLDSGLSYEAAPEIANEFERMRRDSAEITENLEKAEAERDTVKAERDKLQARVDGFDAELKKAKEESLAKATAELKGRADALDVAKSYNVDVKDEMKVADIKKAVAQAFRGDSADLSEKSEAYIDAVFDMAKEQRKDSGMQRQRQAVNGNGSNDGGASGKRNDSAYNADEAYDRYVKRITGQEDE